MLKYNFRSRIDLIKPDDKLNGYFNDDLMSAIKFKCDFIKFKNGNSVTYITLLEFMVVITVDTLIGYVIQ